MDQNTSLNLVQPNGGRAVLSVLTQMAEYDEREHEGKLADLIVDQIGDGEPSVRDVVVAAVKCLEHMAEDRDTELTCQALGYLQQQEPWQFDADTPVTPADHRAVLEARRFALDLASALKQLFLREHHSTQEQRLGL